MIGKNVQKVWSFGEPSREEADSTKETPGFGARASWDKFLASQSHTFSSEEGHMTHGAAKPQNIIDHVMGAVLVCYCLPLGETIFPERGDQ